MNDSSTDDHVVTVVDAVFREVFDVPRLGPGDDFFSLGGHSTLAVRIASRLRTELGLRVPVRMVFENPTARELARALGATGRTGPQAGPGDTS